MSSIKAMSWPLSSKSHILATTETRIGYSSPEPISDESQSHACPASAPWSFHDWQNASQTTQLSICRTMASAASIL